MSHFGDNVIRVFTLKYDKVNPILEHYLPINEEIALKLVFVVKSMLAYERHRFDHLWCRGVHLSPFSSLTVSLAVSLSVGGAGCVDGTLMNMGTGVEGGSGRVAIVSAPEFTSSIALRSCENKWLLQ